MVNMLNSLQQGLPGRHGRLCVVRRQGADLPGRVVSRVQGPAPAHADDLAARSRPIHRLVKLGLAWLEVPGVEADDTIGTLARRGAEPRPPTWVISTGDKDMAQLVTPQVSLVNTMTSETLDIGVLGKFGVPPERIVDYLTLVATPWTTCPAWKSGPPRRR